MSSALYPECDNDWGFVFHNLFQTKFDNLCSDRQGLGIHISLTPELERMVRGKVESGLYNTASEVVREALRLSLKQPSENDWIG